jgi:prepilin-type N-terminal cleavage/methylation domain-containing protein
MQGEKRAASGARSEPEASGGGGAGYAGAVPARLAGFTLLEVMAAVALLAILYTVLARVAIEGLRGEGESKRRLEAALLADARIAESFTAFSGGFVMPELGHSELTEGEFTLALDVALFQPPVEWGFDEKSGGPPPLLFATSPGVPGVQALRTVQLQVSWLEGGEKRGVSRTIYLMDFNRISQLVASSQQAPSAPAETAAPEEPTTFEELEAQLPSEAEQQ